ncbi:hypothetical protein EW146_g7801 [Bondarzewia mesenterica]|uniref:Uncharacterized protein n=1 Tax=Bondarzewia mesenterica TaxID=1095465 RepID=A0A4S4LQ04_9AGAM|nr:hypothetical protein EW146_g7801 [Bondarzewia mesenterica]
MRDLDITSHGDCLETRDIHGVTTMHTAASGKLFRRSSQQFIAIQPPRALIPFSRSAVIGRVVDALALALVLALVLALILIPELMIVDTQRLHIARRSRSRPAINTDLQAYSSTLATESSVSTSRSLSTESQSSVTDSSDGRFSHVRDDRRRRRRSSDLGDLPPGSDNNNFYEGSPKLCRRCHRSPYQIHGRTDVLPALQLEPHSALLAAYRLTHLSGAPPSQTALDSPLTPSHLPLHLLLALTPTEKRARRLAIALDSDDPTLKDWGMEEYLKLGQAGRRLVREGVFEVEMVTEVPQSREDMEEEEKEHEWAVEQFRAGKADEVLRTAAGILSRLLQAQEESNVGWKDGEWGLTTPAFREPSLDIGGERTSEGDVQEMPTAYDAKGKGKAIADTLLPSMEASPTPVPAPLPPVLAVSTDTETIIPAKDITPDGVRTPNNAIPISPELLTYTMSSISRTHTRTQTRPIAFSRSPDNFSLYSYDYSYEPIASPSRADDDIAVTSDMENVPISSDIEGSDGGLTTPSHSRRVSPSRRRGRHVSSGLTTPMRSPSTSPTRTTTPLPVPVRNLPLRLFGGAASDSDQTSRPPSPAPSRSPARTPSPSLSADLTPGPPPPSPPSHATQLPFNIPVIPSFDLPSSPHFPRLPPLPPIQFLPALSSIRRHADGTGPPPPVFLALGARRACIPYTPAFQGLDLRVVRPVTARERLAVRDAVGVLTRIGAKVVGDETEGKRKGMMWSLSYVEF